MSATVHLMLGDLEEVAARVGLDLHEAQIVVECDHDPDDAPRIFVRSVEEIRALYPGPGGDYAAG